MLYVLVSCALPHKILHLATHTTHTIIHKKGKWDGIYSLPYGELQTATLVEVAEELLRGVNWGGG